MILIGSRAKNIAKTYSDFDLLIVYRDLKEEIYNTVRRLKSIDLPVDLLLINVENFDPNDKLLREILKQKIIIHDRIKIFSQIN